MPPVPGALYGVAARSSQSALAVGAAAFPDQVKALVALWNGTAWKTLSVPPLPASSSLDGVALFRGGAWAVGVKGFSTGGQTAGYPLMVRVTGTRVRQVPVPRADNGSGLGDVVATSATDAWAAGTDPGGPLFLHWNGTAWKRVQLPAAVARGVGSVDAVAATSRTNVWAVLGTGGRLPKIAHWNGRRWANVASPHIGTPYGLGAVAASGKNVWALGSGVIVHWNGRKWTCTRTLDNLWAITASSADNAWAVGNDGNEQDVALHWNGHTWQHVITPQQNLSTLDGIAIVPRSGRAWAVGFAADAGTLMLHWNGTAWH